ncbi:MAG TPA: hypothetical protein VK071_02565 [Tissierellales bacterium]|nr:hypothetical protein [Tissierellales bacterium]
MGKTAVLIWLMGILLDIVGLIMLYVNYRMGRSTKKSWIIAIVGFVLIFTIVILNDMGKL